MGVIKAKLTTNSNCACMIYKQPYLIKFYKVGSGIKTFVMTPTYYGPSSSQEYKLVQVPNDPLAYSWASKQLKATSAELIV